MGRAGLVLINDGFQNLVKEIARYCGIQRF